MCCRDKNLNCFKLLRGEQRCKKGGKNNPFERWDDTLYTSTNNHEVNAHTCVLPV